MPQNSQLTKHVQYFEQEEIENVLTKPGAEALGLSTTGWYFWNEAGNYATGPYEVEHKAYEAYNAYCAIQKVSPNNRVTRGKLPGKNSARRGK